MKRILNILLIAGSVASIAITFFFSVRPAGTVPAPASSANTLIPPSLAPMNAVPFSPIQGAGITRALQLKTSLPDKPDDIVTEYVVKSGDSPSSIAQKFGLKPETILWSNDQLNASAGSLRIGDTLKILPVNGVLHTVKDGDTLEKIQAMHGTPVEEIVEYPGNGFDLTQPPKLVKGQQIIVPNGTSPILWAEAQAPSVASSIYSGKYPNLGTGSFIWPLAPPYVLTQEYWSGHPGIDVDTYFRQPLFAADSGTVVFAGWNSTGYGNMVIIDHGNGYKTYYSHNEANLVREGQVVIKGEQIAESGSTGNSTGDHIDFRIVYNGTFLNPMDFLP